MRAADRRLFDLGCEIAQRIVACSRSATPNYNLVIRAFFRVALYPIDRGFNGSLEAYKQYAIQQIHEALKALDPEALASYDFTIEEAAGYLERIKELVEEATAVEHVIDNLRQALQAGEIRLYPQSKEDA